MPPVTRAGPAPVPRRASFEETECAVLAAPGFSLVVYASDEEIVGAEYRPPGWSQTPGNALLAEAARQFAAYLADPAFRFGLPLRPSGTAFQRRVWQAIAEIPSGGVLSYGALAARLRSGPRAVGGACGANPYPLIVPCHRVVAAAGLGGFGGVGGEDAPLDFLIALKRRLLAHEGLDY